MKIYTVHRREGEMASDTQSLRFVKEGFAWLGFLLPLPWLLFHRLWLAALAFVIASIGVGLTVEYVVPSDMAAFFLGLLINLYVGLEGNEWRRAKLAKSGFVNDGVTSGDTLEAAELAYFQRKETVSMPRRRPAMAPVSSTGDDAGIGLFPAPGGA